MANTARTRELQYRLHYRYGYEDGVGGIAAEESTAGYEEGYADGVAEARHAENEERSADL